METWLEKRGASQEELETNREKKANHYKPAPCVKDTHMLTAQLGQTSDVLHGDSKEATYEKTIEALENQFEDQRLGIG